MVKLVSPNNANVKLRPAISGCGPIVDEFVVDSGIAMQNAKDCERGRTSSDTPRLRARRASRRVACAYRPGVRAGKPEGLRRAWRRERLRLVTRYSQPCSGSPGAGKAESLESSLGWTCSGDLGLCRQAGVSRRAGPAGASQ